jgi:hypothetical protein
MASIKPHVWPLTLFAAALQELGLHRATDVVGGYQEMVRAGVLENLR